MVKDKISQRERRRIAAMMAAAQVQALTREGLEIMRTARNPEEIERVKASIEAMEGEIANRAFFLADQLIQEDNGGRYFTCDPGARDQDCPACQGPGWEQKPGPDELAG